MNTAIFFCFILSFTLWLILFLFISSHFPLVSAVCDELHPCEGLGRYATFKNFGMAFLLLFRVSTGDNWNGIMKVKPTLQFQILIPLVLYIHSFVSALSAGPVLF